MDSLKLFIQRLWPEHKWNPYWPFLAALIGNIQCALLQSFHQKNTVTSQSCCQVRAVIQQCQYRPIAAVRHITKSRTTHQRMSVFRCFSSLLRLYLGPLLFIMALVSWPESITREEHSHLWRLNLLKLHKQDGNSTLYSYTSQHVLQPLNLLTQLPQSLWSNSAK